MAFVLIQHLDPTHESMMGDLLAGHTSMEVRQATDGMALERDHLYLIPPGTYLSVHDGALHLSPPQARHGARLPFDFLLHSLAAAYGPRAICVILSGSGTDGSLGAQAVHAGGGLVIAQDPNEAAFDGMPRAAMATGAVDLVLPVAEIPGALLRPASRTLAGTADRDCLPDIIALLAARTGQDLALYKSGTLRRRIERRMTMAAIEGAALDRYLDLLRRDAAELDELAKDLHIHVTSFFRDPKVFDVLETTVLPDLVRNQPPDRPLRIWIAGCSTGRRPIRWHALPGADQRGGPRHRASVSSHPISIRMPSASAREGLYPESIAEWCLLRGSPASSRRRTGLPVLPELRATVVFAVQDILADPPSRASTCVVPEPADLSGR